MKFIGFSFSSQEDVSKDKMDSEPPNQHTKQEVSKYLIGTLHR